MSKQSSRKLTTNQTELVNQFISITQSNKETAINCLSRFKWKIEQAVDSYFINPDKYYVQEKVDSKKIEALFKKYESPDEEELITLDGIVKFCTDLGIDPNDPNDLRSFILLWKLNVPSINEITKEQFIEGFKSIGVDSINDLKSIINDKNIIKNNHDFKSFYKFCYNFSKEPGKKNISLEGAKYLWTNILKGKYKYLDVWLKFLEDEKKVEYISLDTWTLFYEFTQSVSETMEDYDPMAAWPTIIDDYVEYATKVINK